MDAAMWCLIDRCHSEYQTHESDGQKWMQAGEAVNYTDGLFHHADSSWADRLSVKQASLALIPTGGCCTQSLWSVEDSVRCISRMGCPLFTDLKDSGQVSPQELATVRTLCDQWVSGSWRLWLTCHLFHHKACRQSPEDQSSERELAALDIKKLFTPWNAGSGGGSLPAARLCLQGETMTQWEISL